MDRATKSRLVYDAGRVIERLGEANSSLCHEVEELKSGAGLEVVAVAEQCALDLEEEVNHLRAELNESRARVRMLDDELLTLSRDVESTRSTSWAAEEALKEECLRLPRRIE
ncbi:hypothetical protein C4D60_Mb06t23240 [Musa balbisiana]|uniref:Uncharacterized protein n=1 Tax=Musa balbisiana TaxID=52838 RepID=A0A4S8IQ70_MUSBA|nr:hypothetical protein C4D60_Mb06t23240 [Musa balbisiana]